MVSLTYIQKSYCRYIDMYIRQNDNFPTIKEIAKNFNVSLNAVQCNLTLIEKKGYIEKLKRGRVFKRTVKFRAEFNEWRYNNNKVALNGNRKRCYRRII